MKLNTFKLLAVLSTWVVLPLILVGVIPIHPGWQTAPAQSRPGQNARPRQTLAPAKQSEQGTVAKTNPFATLADPGCLTPQEITAILYKKIDDAALMELKTGIKKDEVYYYGRMFKESEPVPDRSSGFVTKTKYEFEIDAYSGKFRKWNAKNFRYPITDNEQEGRTIKSKQDAAKKLTDKMPGSEIANMEWDMNKKYVFYAGMLHTATDMYRFILDAYTGDAIVFKKIVLPNQEEEGPKVVDVAVAEKTLLTRVPGAVIMSMDLTSNQAGYPIYQGSLQKGHLAYDFTINAMTGKIVNWSQHTVKNTFSQVRPDRRRGPSVPIKPSEPLVPIPGVPYRPMPPAAPGLQPM